MGPKQWGQCRDPHMSWSYIQCYTTHSKWIPYTQVSIGFMWSASSSYNIILSARSSAFPYKTLQIQVKTFSENINHSAVHSPTYKAGQVTQQKLIHSTAHIMSTGLCQMSIHHKSQCKQPSMHQSSPVSSHRKAHFNSVNSLHVNLSIQSTIATIIIKSVPTRWVQL